MELGHWLMIIGTAVIVGGFLYMIRDKSYNLKRAPTSVLIMCLGGLLLASGAVIQDSADMKVEQKQCLGSGGEWLGKKEYNIATKTHVTKYNCYILKDK